MLQVDAPKKGQGREGSVPGVSGVVGSSAAATLSVLGFFSRERNSAVSQITARPRCQVHFGGADCRCFRRQARGNLEDRCGWFRRVSVTVGQWKLIFCTGADTCDS